MKQNKILIIGDINSDLIITGLKNYPAPGEESYANDYKIKMGGGAAISSLALSKLGLNPSVFGCVGDDIFSELLTNELRLHGINLKYLKRIKNTSTGMSVTFTNETNRSFITCRSALDHTNLDDVTTEVIDEFDYIFLHNFIPSKIEEYILFCKKVKSKGKKIIFDVGFDDTGKWDKKIFEVLKYVDIFIPDELEALSFTRCDNIEEALKELSIYCKQVVIKIGKKGAVALDGSDVIYSPTFEADCVDTTGAGDSFDAGFIYGTMNDMDLKKCLALGNFLGSLSVTSIGGSTGIPENDELSKLIKANNIL
jgi:sugar/nucleoside kinase (ribokinase family)